MEQTTKKIDLLSLLPEEMEQYILSLGEPKYRAKQLFIPIHKGIDPQNITNIGKALKLKIGESSFYSLPIIMTGRLPWSCTVTALP